MKFSGKTLIITGAASGIGRELVLEAVRRGASVAIADLDHYGALATLNQCEDIAGDSSRCSAHQLDVSKLDSWRALKSEVGSIHGAVDGVINNAGITFAGTVEDTSYSHYESVMSINFMGMVYGTREFLDDLKARPEAVIANVSSLFGVLPVRNQSAYCASKFAIRGFTEVLAQELRGTKVTVTSVQPGHVGTSIMKNASKSGHVVVSEYSDEYVKAYAQEFEKQGMPPSKAARIIFDGLAKNKRQIVFGADARRAVLLRRVFDDQFVDRLNDAVP